MWVVAVVVVLVVVSAIGNAIAPRGVPAAEATSNTSPASAPTPVASTPAQSATPASVASPAGPSESELNAAAFAALQAQFGGVARADVFASDSSLWYGWIAGTRVEGSNFYVTLQVGPGDDERRDIGARAASAIPTLLPAEAKAGLSWVIVEDATGVVIDQKML